MPQEPATTAPPSAEPAPEPRPVPPIEPQPATAPDPNPAPARDPPPAGDEPRAFARTPDPPRERRNSSGGPAPIYGGLWGSGAEPKPYDLPGLGPELPDPKAPPEPKAQGPKPGPGQFRATKAGEEATQPSPTSTLSPKF
jgi:hypothetical protein